MQENTQVFVMHNINQTLKNVEINSPLTVSLNQLMCSRGVSDVYNWEKHFGHRALKYHWSIIRAQLDLVQDSISLILY